MQAIKETAHQKVWAKFIEARNIANDPNIYWKIDEDRRLELNERDIFEQKVWGYILGLIEKDNKL